MMPYVFHWLNLYTNEKMNIQNNGYIKINTVIAFFIKPEVNICFKNHASNGYWINRKIL
jgi:hypothetical protein